MNVLTINVKGNEDEQISFLEYLMPFEIEQI